jgi:hypothetical protein
VLCGRRPRSSAWACVVCYHPEMSVCPPHFLNTKFPSDIPLPQSPVLGVQIVRGILFARYGSSLFVRRLLFVCLGRVLVSRVCCSLRLFGRRMLGRRLFGRGGRERIGFLRRGHRGLVLWQNLAVMLSCRGSSGE